MTDRDTRFRWQFPSPPAEPQGPGALPSLAEIEAFVREVAGDLDPESRYVSELLAVLRAATDTADYLARLRDPQRTASFRQDGSRASTGERGFSWVDDATWAGMDVWERTLSNLLTGETRMMWAGEGQADFEHFPAAVEDLSGELKLLSIPSSTGKEVFSLAIAGLLAGRQLSVTGVDRQQAYLERARSGRLIPHTRDWQHPRAAEFLEQGSDGVTRVREQVRALCRFVPGDLLTGELPEGPFHLVSCRNLLGYFRGQTLETALSNVSRRVGPGGRLLLDGFVSGGAEMAPARGWLEAQGWRRLFPQANYYVREASA